MTAFSMKFTLKTLLLWMAIVALVCVAVARARLSPMLLRRVYVSVAGVLIVSLLFHVLHVYRKLTWRIALFLVWLFLVGMLIVDLYAIGLGELWGGGGRFQVGVLCPLAFFSGTAWLLYWMVWMVWRR